MGSLLPTDVVVNWLSYYVHFQLCSLWHQYLNWIFLYPNIHCALKCFEMIYGFVQPWTCSVTVIRGFFFLHFCISTSILDSCPFFLCSDLFLINDCVCFHTYVSMMLCNYFIVLLYLPFCITVSTCSQTFFCQSWPAFFENWAEGLILTCWRSLGQATNIILTPKCVWNCTDIIYCICTFDVHFCWLNMYRTLICH